MPQSNNSSPAPGSIRASLYREFQRKHLPIVHVSPAEPRMMISSCKPSKRVLDAEKGKARAGSR